MRKLELVTTCVGLPQSEVHFLEDMEDAGKEITYSTFKKHINASSLAKSLGYSVGHEAGLKQKDDYHVRYFKSVWKGNPCFHMVHSAIDHIFQ